MPHSNAVQLGVVRMPDGDKSEPILNVTCRVTKRIVSPDGSYVAEITDDGAEIAMGASTSFLTIYRSDKSTEPVTQRNYGLLDAVGAWSDDSNYFAWIEWVAYPVTDLRMGARFHAPDLSSNRSMAYSVAHNQWICWVKGPCVGLPDSFDDLPWNYMPNLQNAESVDVETQDLWFQCGNCESIVLAQLGCEWTCEGCGQKYRSKGCEWERTFQLKPKLPFFPATDNLASLSSNMNLRSPPISKKSVQDRIGLVATAMVIFAMVMGGVLLYFLFWLEK